MIRVRTVSLVAAAPWVTLVCLALSHEAQANVFQGRKPLLPALSAGTDTPKARSSRPAVRTRPMVPATNPTAGSSVGRAASAVLVASSTAAGQSGYVHFFQITLPDGASEIQVGLELADQRIAWSFPGLGVTISPFIEDGVIAAGGNHYEVWHRYGVRPFPDDTTMGALQKDLAQRIEPWVRAATPYCAVDGLGSHCMSCLGFVLRALFPGRGSDALDLPGDFWRTSALGRYSPNDLLLYLTGMLDLPTREARLRRITQLALPAGLREDLEELVYSIGVTESAAPERTGAAQKRPLARQSWRAGSRPTQGGRL